MKKVLYSQSQVILDSLLRNLEIFVLFLKHNICCGYTKGLAQYEIVLLNT